MRGTAWVNTLQTLLFLSFGTIALILIGVEMGGFGSAVQSLLEQRSLAPLLTRERIPARFFFSYTFIPLSAMAFPHIAIFCFTARKMAYFRRTVIFYPLCIMAIWLPCVYLGVMANHASDVPEIQAKQQARSTLALQGAKLDPALRDQLREQMAGDEVMILLLNRYAPFWLAGILGAGIMAAVMASDSQILALATMFTEDVFAFYGGKDRYGEAVQVHTGRLFVIILTLVAYIVALRASLSIFELAIQYAFSGFAALSPLLAAALFWKGSTKWGALAATLWVLTSVIGIAAIQYLVPAPPPGPQSEVVVWSFMGEKVITRTFGGTSIFGFLPVVPMTLISALLIVVVSLLTPKPGESTLRRYFP
jgi:SSS family solute:Na+ symporter